MSNEKLFTIAGIATFNEQTTYRFANGNVKTRTAKLIHHGCTGVTLFELPNPMTKTAAISFLAEQDVTAQMPVTRSKSKPVVLTAEDEAAAKKAAFVKRMAESRAAKKAARIAAEDHNYIAELTGGEKIEVPEDTAEIAAEDTAESITAEAEDTVSESVEELLAMASATETAAE